MTNLSIKYCSYLSELGMFLLYFPECLPVDITKCLEQFLLILTWAALKETKGGKYSQHNKHLPSNDYQGFLLRRSQ